MRAALPERDNERQSAIAGTSAAAPTTFHAAEQRFARAAASGDSHHQDAGEHQAKNNGRDRIEVATV
jgi:hypothetical protein